MNDKLYIAAQMFVVYMCISTSTICSYTGMYTEDFMDSTGYGDRQRDWEWLSLMKKTAVDSKTNGKKPVDPHATWFL